MSNHTTLPRNTRVDLTAVSRTIEDELTAEEAAEKLDISVHAFYVARDVVYLMREEMDAEEWGVVAEAVKLISQYNVKPAKELIAPVVHRHFGSNPGYPGGPLRARDALTNKFLQAATSMADSMRMGVELQVPWMASREREEVVADLRDAMDHVEKLIHVIEQGGSHNVSTDD